MDTGTQIFWLFVLSMIVASVSWTVTQEEIFREPREYCADRSKNCRSLFERKFYYVFTCEYCFSHWVSLVLVVFMQFKVAVEDWRGYVLAFFILPWLANFWMSIYRRLRVGIKHENVLAEEAKERLNSEK